jgi:hypothetical protein
MNTYNVVIDDGMINSGLVVYLELTSVNRNINKKNNKTAIDKTYIIFIPSKG